jgi:molybdenum cofactor synthesis domain-containing protein
MKVAVVTISDSSFALLREDLSGPALADRARALGWTVSLTRVVPDDAAKISETLLDLMKFDLVLTTGGTGVSPRDVTPEAVRAIAYREIPGFGELMRQEGLKKTKFAPLSRSAAYTRGETLILTLPGSPAGAVDSLDAVAYLIPHVVDLLHGKTKHEGKPAASGPHQD